MDKLSLYFITWNVATRAPGESLRSLLDLGRYPTEELPDFYFIGLQEVKSQPQNFVFDALLEDPWTKAFKNALSPHDYVKVKSIRLVGIMLNVFCLRKHLTHLRQMESLMTRTGLLGLWGNKGATSLRLSIYGVNMCIVNAHFAAHEHQNQQRINDYNAVIKEQNFVQDVQTSKILYHDYVFWIGDLNFRLNNPDGSYSMDNILQKIKDNQLDDLFAQDQLIEVMRSGEAFSELNETKPSFQPTFKYRFDSHNYDSKRRCAWTDRILFKVNANNYENVTLSADQLKYTSLQDYGTSDHKPVISEFKIKVCPTIFGDGCYTPVEFDRRRRDTSQNLMQVAFSPVETWRIDQRNTFEVTFGGGYQPDPWDWIGVYAENFSSLDDYLCYIYVPVPVQHSNKVFSNFDEEGTNALESELEPSTSSYTAQTEVLTNIFIQNNSNDKKCDSITNDSSEKISNNIDTKQEKISNNIDTKQEKISNNIDNNVSKTSSSIKSKNKIQFDSLKITFPDSAIRYPGNYRLIYFTKSSSDVLGISNIFSAVDTQPDVNKHYNLDW